MKSGNIVHPVIKRKFVSNMKKSKHNKSMESKESYTHIKKEDTEVINQATTIVTRTSEASVHKKMKIEEQIDTNKSKYEIITDQGDETIESSLLCKPQQKKSGYDSKELLTAETVKLIKENEKTGFDSKELLAEIAKLKKEVEMLQSEQEHTLLREIEKQICLGCFQITAMPVRACTNVQCTAVYCLHCAVINSGAMWCTHNFSCLLGAGTSEINLNVCENIFKRSRDQKCPRNCGTVTNLSSMERYLDGSWATPFTETQYEVFQTNYEKLEQKEQMLVPRISMTCNGLAKKNKGEVKQCFSCTNQFATYNELVRHVFHCSKRTFTCQLGQIPHVSHENHQNCLIPIELEEFKNEPVFVLMV